MDSSVLKVNLFLLDISGSDIGKTYGLAFQKESIESIQLAEILMKFDFSKNGLRIRFSLDFRICAHCVSNRVMKHGIKEQ